MGTDTDIASIKMETSAVVCHDSIIANDQYHESLKQVFSTIGQEYRKVDPKIAIRYPIRRFML